jgi:hypothetical protein
MSPTIANHPRVELDARRSLISFIAAGLVAVILLALTTNPVAAASTVKASVVDGTLVVKGTPSRDRIALRVSKAHPNRLQIDIGDNGSADLTFRLRTFDAIDVRAGDGNDRIRLDTGNGAFTSKRPTRVRGQDGDDTLIGGSGPETFVGGRGNDLVDANGGADTALLGSGNDTFVWHPDDGSDIVRGGTGNDTVAFTGSGADEEFNVTQRVGRVSFTRDDSILGGPGHSGMDLDDVETIRLSSLGGADRVNINDLTGSDLTRVDVDLAATIGGAAPDASGDAVAVKGTDGDDTVAVTASGSTVEVEGLAAVVRILHPMAGDDTLAIDTLGGDDRVTVDPSVLDLIGVIGP